MRSSIACIVLGGVALGSSTLARTVNNCDIHTGTICSQSSLSAARLAGSELAMSNFMRADLSHADLSEARLDGAKLQRANFGAANLTGATFDGADLRGAQSEVDRERGERVELKPSFGDTSSSRKKDSVDSQAGRSEAVIQSR